MSIETAEKLYATKTLSPRAGHYRRCIEAMRSMIKTVKDHAATKTLPQWAVDVIKA